MDKQLASKYTDSDLAAIGKPPLASRVVSLIGIALVKPVVIVVVAILFIGGIVHFTRDRGAATGAPVVVAAIAAPAVKAPAPSEPAAVAAPAADKPAALDPVLAAAIASPHDEVVEKKPLTPGDHLRIARQLEREAAKNRRVAAVEYRRQAAQYRRIAQLDRRKAQNNARLANVYQRLAQRSVRRGA